MRVSLIAALGLVAAGCQGLEVSETEQAIITGVQFSPLSGGTVGNVQINTASTPFGITVYPVSVGQVTYTINAISGCSDFSINAPGLPATIQRYCVSYEPCSAPQCVPNFQPICDEWDITQYDFSATFHPTVAGASSCPIQLSVSGIATQPVYVLNGTGTLPPIAMDVTPPAIAFGDVRRNTASSAATVNVRNSGGQALAISQVQVTAGFVITSGPTGGASVPVGATQPYTVTCNPSATGPLSGSLRVTSNAPNSPVSVSLTCNGIDSALDVSPSPAAIPTTRVGEPAQRAVQLTNSGGAPMTIESATLTGADLSASGLPTAGQQLAAGGGSVTATISFDAMAAGDASGALTVTYDGGQTRTIPVSAKAVATSMAMSPDGMIDLGPVCAGQSATQEIAISANAEGSFRVTDIAAPDAPFTLDAPALPATAEGSGANHLTMTVGVAPTDAGPLTGTLSVTTDIPNGTPRSIALAATGLTAGVSATPAEIELGPAAVNTTTIGQTVSITNCATSSAALANPRIEGADAGDFAIVQQPQNLTVDANGGASFLVIAQPHSVGPKTAVFSVDHPGGTASVTLTADGTGEGGGSADPGGTDSRPSYYACSAGGSATGAWPLGLALAFALARRKRRAAC